MASKQLVFDIVGRDRSASKAINDVSNTLLGVGVAAAAGMGVAVKKFAEFDQQMSLVKDGTRASAGEMDLLREAALKAGQDTKYSATESAAAIDALGRAGVSTGDILGGGLTGALDLAAAGNLDVAQAAEIAAVAMVQFKKSGEDVPHIADLLAAGAGKAMGSVDDLSQALNQSGLVASQAGLSIEETAGTLAAFASAGLAGSDGGTSFKTMLQRLNPVSAAARDKMDELGISAYDAQGNFIGMEKYAGVLHDALEPLSSEARNSALNIMFGSDAVRAASVIYEQGAEGVRTWIDDTNDAGYAAESAAIQMDNLSGDVEQLGGSIETALIKQGSGANDVLRTLTQGATDVVNGFSNLPPELQGTVTTLALVAGGAALVTGAALKVIPAIDRTRTSLRRLNVDGAKAGKILGRGAGLTAVIVGLTGAVSAFGNTVALAADDQSKLAAALKVGNLDEISNSFEDANGNASDFATQLEALYTDDFFRSANSAIAFNGAIKGVSFGMIDLNAALDKNRAKFTELGVEIGTTAQTDFPKAASQFKQLAELAGGGEDAVRMLLEAFPDYEASLRTLAGAQGQTLTDQELMNLAMGKGVMAMQLTRDAAAQTSVDLAGMGQAASETDQKISDLADQIRNFGSATLDTRAAQREYQQAIDDATAALETNGATLDINTQAGRDNQSALDDIAKSAADQAAAIWESTGSEEGLQEALKNSRSDLIKAAEKFGLSEDAARDYADQVLATPEEVKTTVEVAGITAARQAFESLIADYNNRSVTIRAVMDAADKLPGNAAGGAIYGPGQKGVDSVLRMLAPGEHVLTAAEVDAMGGQSAVYAFRRQLGSKASMIGSPSVNAVGIPVPSYGAGSASMMAGGSGTSQMVVYVQNPWGADYMESQTVRVADQRIATSDRQSQQLAARGRTRRV